MSFKPRCWARRASDGRACPEPAGHDDWHEVQVDPCTIETWSNRQCAPDAGPAGRETAALRILEISHEIDRRAFLANEHSPHASLIRALAARLRAALQSAPADLQGIEHALADWRRRRGKTGFDGLPEEIDRDGLPALFEQVAEILRPFAEGGR